MLYLENVLESMKNNTDVMVMLSSYTTYEFTDYTAQDGCGNHHAATWLAAIELYSLQKVFVVDSVTVAGSPYMEKPQWIITLFNEKNRITDILDNASNECACQKALRNRV